MGKYISGWGNIRVARSIRIVIIVYVYDNGDGNQEFGRKGELEYP